MKSQFERQEPPDVSEEQQAVNELIKLIRKLRWLGMDDEAARVQMTLATSDVRLANCVITGPGETD